MQRSCILKKTPHDLFSSLSFMYPTRLNVVSMARGETKQNYKLSGAQYATSCILTEHHIKYLVLSFLATQQY